MNQPKLPYILIFLIVCLVVAAFWFGYQKTNILEQRDTQVEQRMEDWIRIIEMINEQQKEFMINVSQKEVEKKQIRMDVGKEIKQFNTVVKRIKEIEDPYESIRSLDRAWGNSTIDPNFEYTSIPSYEHTSFPNNHNSN